MKRGLFENEMERRGDGVHIVERRILCLGRFVR